MVFQPGQSGNPQGRPAGARNAETLFRDAIEKIAKDQNVEDVERDLVITLLAKAKKGDLKALDMYMDRLYGKPVQKITGEMKQEIHLSGEKRNMLETLLGIRNK